MKRKTLKIIDGRTKHHYCVARDVYEKVTRHLSPYEIAIYLEMVHAIDSGAETSRTEIAGKLRISRRKVAESIVKLIKIGAIRVSKDGVITLLGA